MCAEKLWREKAEYGLHTQVLYLTMPQPKGCKHIMNYNNNNNNKILGVGEACRRYRREMERRQHNAGTFISIFPYFLMFICLSLGWNSILFISLICCTSCSFIVTIDQSVNQIVPLGNGLRKKKKEEDLDRMYDEISWRLKLNMGGIPRSCIPVCHSLKATSIK